MLLTKSQVNKMDQISVLRSNTISYILISLMIIIISPISQAQIAKSWVFFSDRDGENQAQISDRALQRRALRGSLAGLTEYDYYPPDRYLDSLKAAGYEIVGVSRWLNAVSVVGGPEISSTLDRYPFIRDIRPVAIFRQKTPEAVPITPGLDKGNLPPGITAFDYGPAYNQVHLCQIDSLHSLDLSGSDVLIGMMDTGFDLNHPTFADVVNSNRIIATYDFINDEEDVQESGAQAGHGTATFSVMSGFTEGSLIGAAYGADFLLAETEIQNEEIIAEEDNWVEAAEWMEAQGADVISSSLGYIDWYTQSQLDGHTCAITIAANIANSLGVVVVNSAGNERGNLWGTIIPPADGDSVIAAGGVNANGALWLGSSPGPTADGRIKPDVCAMAQGTIAAVSSSSNFYGFTGTSMAAPLIAGGIALILEANPDWDLSTVIANLKRSATNANSPNNDYGWGIAQFYNMYSGQTAKLKIRFFVAPSPAVNSVTFQFNPPISESAKIVIFTVSGVKVNTLQIEAQENGTSQVSWNAKNNYGKKIASGIYLARLQHQSDCQTIKFAFVN